MAVDTNANTDSRQRRALQRLLASGQIHGHVAGETPAGLVDGANVTYTLAHTPKTGSLQLFLNGVLQHATTDYTIAGATVTFLTAPFTGELVRAWYVQAA